MKLALILGCVQALTVHEQYMQFLATYGRPWRSSGLKAFADNLERNANSSTHGITPFSDLTPEEFRTLYLTPELGQIARANPPAHSAYRDVAPPPSIDWRTKGVVPAVENQGAIGDIIPFVAADNTASAQALVHPPLIPMSEIAAIRNQFNKCAKCQPQADFLCLYNYAVTNKGVCSGFTTDCKCTPDIHIASFKSIKDEANLLNAVALGPVSAYVNAGPWQTYRGGVFTSSCPATVDHAALVVGYGTEGGVDYWILKNSWGTAWGEQGYIRLKRGSSGAGQCGIAVGDFYPVAA